MSLLIKITNLLLKAIFIIVTFAIAVVPIVYILGSEPASPQLRKDSFRQFSEWSGVLQLKQHPIVNIHLVGSKTRLTWKNINSTLNLANYIQSTFQQQKTTVIKKVLPFNKPPKANNINLSIVQSSQIRQTPPLQWLKDMLEPYIKLQHQSFKNKCRIIVGLGELDSKVINEIEGLHKQEPLTRFIIVSLWPINNRLIDAFRISFPNYSKGQTLQNQTLEATPPPPPPKKGKEVKQKRYKVKHVKEQKQTKPSHKSNQL